MVPHTHPPHPPPVLMTLGERSVPGVSVMTYVNPRGFPRRVGFRGSTHKFRFFVLIAVSFDVQCHGSLQTVYLLSDAPCRRPTRSNPQLLVVGLSTGEGLRWSFCSLTFGLVTDLLFARGCRDRRVPVEVWTFKVIPSPKDLEPSDQFIGTDSGTWKNFVGGGERDVGTSTYGLHRLTSV